MKAPARLLVEIMEVVLKLKLMMSLVAPPAGGTEPFVQLVVELQYPPEASAFVKV